MRRPLIAIALSLSLIACSDSDNTADSKSLFSVWTDQRGNAMDLRGGSFNETLELSFRYPNGAECTCDLVVVGNNKSGSYLLNSCAPNHSSFEKINCGEFNHVGDYSLYHNTLTICDGHNCETYR